MANALADLLNNPNMNFAQYGGQNVRIDPTYMQTLKENPLGMDPMAYDKMINPSTYGARWGVADTSQPQATPTSGASVPAARVPSEQMQRPEAPLYNSFASAPTPTLEKAQSTPFDFQADPGAQFRKDEANKAMQAQQLASGGFFSGGAMKEAATLNSNLASQEYGNAFNRYLSNDANQYRNTTANNANAMGQWGANDAAGFRNNQSNFSNEFNRFKTLDDTNYNRAQTADNTDYNRWNDQYNRNLNADNTNWNRLTQLDTSGQNATNAGNVAGQNMANNVGNLQQAQGQASADAGINRSNSWTNALGNALYGMKTY